MKRISYFTLLILLSICFPSYSQAIANANDGDLDKKKDLADGPYIIHQTDGKIRVLSTDTNGIMKDTIYRSFLQDYEFPVISHSGKHSFTVKLHEISRTAWKYEAPEKLFVISDPHGNMDCFVSVLRANNVIDNNYNWSFDNNHLMIIGDVFDRGYDVLPIFWLIYKLEDEAQKQGGHVSFILGNHEPMILAGDYRYMKDSYKELAEKLGVDYKELFSAQTELGRWLGTRNTVEIIGDDLFVHAGLSVDFLNANLEISQVNEEMSRGLFLTKSERNELSPLTKFLYGSKGPIWYRGMVRNGDKYFPIHAHEVQQILNRYQAKRIIVGHTIFPDIRNLYGGRVIVVNVDNKKNFDSVLGRGILIKGDDTFVISDKGVIKKLEMF